MTDELVQRLRNAATEIAREGHHGWGNSCLDAADEIERLRAEVDGSEWELARQMNADFNRIRNQTTTIEQLQSKLAALRKRVEESALVTAKQLKGGVGAYDYMLGDFNPDEKSVRLVVEG